MYWRDEKSTHTHICMLSHTPYPIYCYARNETETHTHTVFCVQFLFLLLFFRWRNSNKFSRQIGHGSRFVHLLFLLLLVFFSFALVNILCVCACASGWLLANVRVRFYYDLIFLPPWFILIQEIIFKASFNKWIKNAPYEILNWAYFINTVLTKKEWRREEKNASKLNKK